MTDSTMTDSPTAAAPRRAPRIRIESAGAGGYPGATRVLVDGVDLAPVLRGITWHIGVENHGYATADLEVIHGASLEGAIAAPTDDAMRQLEKVNSLKLRSQAKWLTRDGQLRTVVTDTESASGAMPRCASPEHPAEDRDRQWDVHDCCDTGFIEMGHEVAAAFYVEALAAIPALLDEREQMRARIAELEAETRQLRTLNAAAAGLYRERAHLVAALAAEHDSWWGDDPENPTWPVAYVGLPTGQVSWHISPEDWIDLFAHLGLDHGTLPWDGHDTDEKYRRLDEYTRRVARERREHPMHTVDTAREQLLHDSPALADQIREGIAEAEAGQTVYLGSFAEHLDDDGGPSR